MRAPGVNNIQLNTQIGDEDFDREKIGTHLHQRSAGKEVIDEMKDGVSISQFRRTRRSFEELAAKK